MEAVNGKTKTGKAVIFKDDTGLVAEIRIPWGDIDAAPQANGEFLVNVAPGKPPNPKRSSSSPARC
jgi:hypothetical protein